MHGVKATRDKEVNDDNYKYFILMCWKVEKGSSNPRDQSNFLLPEVTDNMKITVQSNQAKQENESILVFFFLFQSNTRKKKLWKLVNILTFLNLAFQQSYCLNIIPVISKYLFHVCFNSQNNKERCKSTW